ncbi:MAG: hypothetical protein AAGF78_12135 [Pseudomonadota bacterium]
MRDVFRVRVRLLWVFEDPPGAVAMRLATRMDAVAVPSRSAQMPANAVVVPPAVDTARYAPPLSRSDAQRALGLPEGSLYIGWLGPGDPGGFVRAMITLCREDRRIRGVIRTAPIPRPVAEIRNAGLHHRIRFAPGGDDLAWLQALDGCVADDPDDLPARQAMACGVPICEPGLAPLRALIRGTHEPLPDPSTLSEAARQRALDALRAQLLR